MKNMLLSALVCVLASNVQARNRVLVFQVYSSPSVTDIYHIEKRPESVCMYGMDGAPFGAFDHNFHGVTFHYDSRMFRHCGWHDSWQRFAVRRSDGASAVLQWHGPVGLFSSVTVKEDPYHLICDIFPETGICWPVVLIGDGTHCPSHHPSSKERGCNG